MTAELTEEHLAWVINEMKEAHPAVADDLDRIHDAALRDVRATRQKPSAWRVDLEDSAYIVDDIDDAQLVDDCTNHDATVTPLYESPKPTYRDGLLVAAAFANDLWQDGIPSQEFGRRIRSFADKEPT